MKTGKTGKDKKYEEPFYRKSSSYILSFLCAAVGYLLLAGAYIFSWYRLSVKLADGERNGFNLLGVIALGFNSRSIAVIVLTVFAAADMLLMLVYILAMLSPLRLRMNGFVDRVTERVRFLRMRKLTGIVLLLINVILIILFTKTDSFMTLVDNISADAVKYEKMIKAIDYLEVSLLRHGIAALSEVLGVVLVVFSIAFTFVLDTLNEDDDSSEVNTNVPVGSVVENVFDELFEETSPGTVGERNEEIEANK